MNKTELKNDLDNLFKFLNERRFFEVIRLGKKFIKSNIMDPDILNALGIAFYNLNQHKKSIVFFKKAISLNSDFAEAYKNIGYSTLFI